MEEEEDCDVLWEGSPLHQHLSEQGLLSPDQEEDAEVQAAFATAEGAAAAAATSSSSSSSAMIPTRSDRDTFGVTSMVWPQKSEATAYLEIEVAQKLLSSELLVQEDEDFVSNFILTDEALESHRKLLTAEAGSDFGGRSYLSEALFISGSLAAVAGTVLYLSERTRVAATVAAVLPTAMAAMASVGSARYAYGS